MSATSRAVLLAALCLGVLLVGIELLITAVALPRIFLDLSHWSELRRASWIINAYLVAYIAAMPLAGRAGDRFGLPRLVAVGMGIFGLGSLLCGAAQSLDQLIAARAVQGAGAGAVLPLATAGASHLYEGAARSRALGLVGGATFLGMAVGPVLGALVLDWLQLRDALAGSGIWAGPLVDLLTPSWRWIFYLSAPLALLVILYVWAAATDWDVHAGRSRMDWRGAALFTTALASGLLAITLVGAERGDEAPVLAIAAGLSLATWPLAVRHMLRSAEPFLDLRLLRDRVFSGAVAVSLLTGYALATVVVGMATFVDRVRFAGPEEQRLVLGTLAAGMAIGAVASGLVLQRRSATTVTFVGLLVAVAGLASLGGVRPDSEMRDVLAALAVAGLGLGLTVTPRSAAALEVAGRAAFGAAGAAVTVGRMAGMALGMAVLTAFGTTRIDAVDSAIRDPVFRDSVLPESLAGRPLADPLVLDAVESWAATEAAGVLGGLFLLAAGVLVIAALPAWLMRDAPGRRGPEAGREADPTADPRGDRGGDPGGDRAGGVLARS